MKKLLYIIAIVPIIFCSNLYACDSFDNCLKASRDCIWQNNDQGELTCYENQYVSDSDNARIISLLKAIAYKLDEIYKKPGASQAGRTTHGE